jgi:phytoene/squalene synthetase
MPLLPIRWPNRHRPTPDAHDAHQKALTVRAGAQADSDDLDHCRLRVQHQMPSAYAFVNLLPSGTRGDVCAFLAFFGAYQPSTGSSFWGRARTGGAANITLEDRLTLAAQSCPCPAPEDRAFSQVIARAHLPIELLAVVAQGLADDQSPQILTDDSALDRHLVSVGAASALIGARIAGVTDPWLLTRCADFGLGLHLLAIASHVAQDAAAGRVYAPTTWLRNEQLSAFDVLEAKASSPALSRVVSRLVVAARAYLDQSALGISKLPWASRWAVNAARTHAVHLLEDIEHHEFDVFSRRPHVGSVTRALDTLSSAMPVVRRIRRKPLAAPGGLDALIARASR